MKIGNTLRHLRRSKDMTQERLAEILGVSPQAVSRWETDSAMPDITLIEPLCNLFGITSDELLGIDVTRRREAVNAICEEADKYSSRGYLERAREILEDGLVKFPDNSEIIYNLMYLSSWQKDFTGDRKFLDEAIKWGEKLLEISTDEHQRHSAVQVLCFAYRDADRLDEAVRMAESMPCMAVSREMLLSSVYSGDKEYACKQSEAINLLQFLSNSLFYMQTKLDSGENVYTPDECAALREKRIALLHLFFENGDFGFYHSHLCDTHREQAFYHARKSDREKTLEHLTLAADHAVKFITSVDEKRTSLVFRNMTNGSWTTNYSDNEAARLLKALDADIFDSVRDDARFVKAVEQLSEVAGKQRVDD